MTRKKFIVLSAVVSALIIAIPFVCNESLSEVYYSISTDKVSFPVKIAFFSDLHSTLYGAGMSELVDSADRFAPDAVIFGGDLFDFRWGEENSVTFVKKLVAKYPCFYSVGNHEFHNGLQEEELIKSEMSKLGVIVLDGGFSDISANGSTIRIHGIDGGDYTDQLENCISGISDDLYSILINHYPYQYPWLSLENFDLILSGHAHGGQWRFPPFINGIYAPGEGILPKYAGGEYLENGTRMIVSRGLQRCLRDFIIPRIFNRPEAVYITIEPQ